MQEWWRGIVVKTAGSAGVLSLSCARLAAGRVTSYQSINQSINQSDLLGRQLPVITGAEQVT